MNILIVDDSKAMRMLVSSNLRRAGYKGHTILEAENGAIGLNMVRQHEPELVLSDWNMPEMTGIEMLEAIKKLKETDDIPKMPAFVFITSESTESMVSMAREKGTLFVINKPFSADVFEEKLAGIIKQ